MPEITCVIRSNADPESRVVAVGGEGWRKPVTDVIREIDDGSPYFVQVNGSRVRIRGAVRPKPSLSANRFGKYSRKRSSLPAGMPWGRLSGIAMTSPCTPTMRNRPGPWSSGPSPSHPRTGRPRMAFIGLTSILLIDRGVV